MHVDPAYREALQACGLDSVQAVLRRLSGRVVAWSRTTDTLHVNGPGRTPGFFVKRYHYTPWRKRVRGFFRGTFFGEHRGRAEFRWLNAMRTLGIPAVRPVAWGERRVAHFVSACFLITEEVPEAVNLTTFAASVADGSRPLRPAQRREMALRLADQLAAMHGAGFAHGQLFWRNILVRLGPDELPEFFFLDAEPPRRRRGRSGRVWQEELAALAASAQPFTNRSERARFYRRYQGADRLTPALASAAAAVEQAARGHRRHEQQRIKKNGLFESWNRQLAGELSASRLALQDS
jgi:hypothetical protein